MIQLKIRAKNAGVAYQNLVYLNLYDKWTPVSDPDTFWLLGELISQSTGKKTRWHLSSDWTNKNRYVTVTITTTRGTSPPPTNNIVELGTTELPLGFYDFNIYQNNNPSLDPNNGSNLDPTGLDLLYTDIANLTQDFALSGATEPVVYTEYTTNDSETESIYITNATQ